MINVFNRKEVCITYDMAEQARVRDILKQNNIWTPSALNLRWVDKASSAHPLPLWALRSVSTAT